MARVKRSDRENASQTLVGQLRDALNSLRMPHAATRLDELIATPKHALSRLEWLWEILEPQVRRQAEARIERRFAASRLPARKTLESFQFSFQPSLDKDLILELGTLAFLDQGRNLLLAGMSGTGKSHLAMALGANACAAGRRVRYTTSSAMLETLNASLAADTLNTALKQYTRPELLIIDEVGLEQVERESASRAGLMQKVLLPRHNAQSTIITSNIPWDAWGDYLGDHLGATAILDRLIHHSHVIVINGPSYREHEHREEVAVAKRQKPKPAKARHR